MGGGAPQIQGSTTLLSDNGDSTNYFPLKYPANEACTIELTDQVIVTGGWGSDPANNYRSNQATVYNEQGWVEDLPSLNTARSGHGCGHFVNTENQQVRHSRNLEVWNLPTDFVAN